MRIGLLGLLLAVAACHAEPEQVARNYDLDFIVTPLPGAGTVRVEMKVRQDRHWLREVEFDRDPRYLSFDGDGDIELGERSIRWRVPTRSGTRAWEVRIEGRRGSSYDAYMDVYTPDRFMDFYTSLEEELFLRANPSRPIPFSQVPIVLVIGQFGL